MSDFKKITLSLGEILELEAELNGARNNITGDVYTEGLLKQKLPIKTKYWLTRLSETTSSEKRTIENLRDELVIKYGQKNEDGTFSIPLKIKNANGDLVANPAFGEFSNQYNQLLETKKEIEYSEINLDELANIETSDNYAVFFKLLTISST